MTKSNKHSASATGHVLCWIVAIFIVVLPRIARLCSPEVWMEDTAGLYHAFTILDGQRPFLDTINCHPPLLEAVLALLYSIFGVSYRVAEIFSAVVMVTTALMLYELCRSLTNRWMALIGVTLFSFSPLLLRYHVFEREVFTVAIATLSFLFLQKKPESPIVATYVGALAVLSAAIKLSGGFLIVAIVLWFAVRRQWMQALRSILAAILVAALLIVFLVARYGSEPYYQLVVLQMIAGERVSWWHKFQTTLVPFLNITLLLGVSGLIIGVSQKPKSVVLTAALFTAITVAFFLFKGSFWPHNLIDLLVPLSLGSVLAIELMLSQFREQKVRLLPSAVLLVGAVFFIGHGALRTETFGKGWGYIPRHELARAADFLRTHTPQDSPIHAPDYLACEARRRVIVDYPELAGPYLWMEKTLLDKGFVGLQHYKEFGPWLEMSRQTSSLWRSQITDAIRQRQASAVVWDSVFPEWSFVLRADLEAESRDQLLEQSGYRRAYTSGHYIIHLRDK